jgi:hypothetical protein
MHVWHLLIITTKYFGKATFRTLCICDSDSVGLSLHLRLTICFLRTMTRWTHIMLSACSNARNAWRILSKFGTEANLCHWRSPKSCIFNSLQSVKTTWLTRLPGPPNLPHYTRVKVTLVARPLLTPVAQKLCRCEHGLFTSRTCVHSRTLLRIEIVCCCSRSI